MIDGKSVLAIIPARGGSKRLPRKNLMALAGKPLIAWTIEAALKSSLIDYVLVSTDDDEIADVSNEYGAMVPFLRPASLASDSATSNDVILHALDALDEEFDIALLLQPTSPLRGHYHIDEALERLVLKAAEGIVSVTPCEHSPLWANTLPADECMNGFLAAKSNRRSQELAQYYRLNGAIYCFKVESIRRNEGVFFGTKVFSYVLPNECSIDIDSQFDFDFATFVIERSLIGSNE